MRNHLSSGDHIGGSTRTTGQFIVRGKTVGKRLRAKLRGVKEQLRRRRHESIAVTEAWRRSVVQGYFNYHAVPMNYGSLATFRHQVARRWHWTLNHRSQRARMTWERFASRVDCWLPRPRLLHPYPSVRFAVAHPR